MNHLQQQQQIHPHHLHFQQQQQQQQQRLVARAQLEPATVKQLLGAGNEAPKAQKGWLCRWTRKQWSRHWFVLKSGSLTYYRGPAAELCSFLDGVLDLSLIKRIELDSVCQVANQQPQQQQFSFSLKMWNGECHLLGASSALERARWLEAISACTDGLQDEDSAASSDSSPGSQLSCGSGRLGLEGLISGGVGKRDQMSLDQLASFSIRSALRRRDEQQLRLQQQQQQQQPQQQQPQQQQQESSQEPKPTSQPSGVGQLKHRRLGCAAPEEVQLENSEAQKVVQSEAAESLLEPERAGARQGGHEEPAEAKGPSQRGLKRVTFDLSRCSVLRRNKSSSSSADEHSDESDDQAGSSDASVGSQEELEDSDCDSLSSMSVSSRSSELDCGERPLAAAPAASLEPEPAEEMAGEEAEAKVRAAEGSQLALELRLQRLERLEEAENNVARLERELAGSYASFGQLEQSYKRLEGQLEAANQLHRLELTRAQDQCKQLAGQLEQARGRLLSCRTESGQVSRQRRRQQQVAATTMKGGQQLLGARLLSQSRKIQRRLAQLELKVDRLQLQR